MTGKERFLAVLNGKQPDRVPTGELDINPRVIRALTGTDDIFVLAEQIGLDGIFVWPDRRKTYLDADHFVDDFGSVRVDTHIPGDYPVPVKFPVEEPEDLAHYKMPSASDERIWAGVQDALDRVGKDLCVVARIRDVISFPRDVLGYENFLVSFITEPEMLSELMDMSVAYSTEHARNLRGLGVDVVCMCDDIANAPGPLMGAEKYHEQVLPHFKKLISNCHDLGLKVIKHSDGNLMPIMDDLIDSGIDCLDPIDPMGNMDMAHIKKTYGDKIAMMGNVDCVKTLVDGTPEEIEEEVKSCLRAGAAGGGLILASSNSIHAGVKPENYLHMVRCVEKYGHYPMDL